MVARNDEVNMTQLAEIMGVTKGAISQTIRKLVHKNLIIRTNINNRKEVNLRLSEKGKNSPECTGVLSEGDFHFCRCII